MTVQNFWQEIPQDFKEEIFEPVLTSPNLKIERILSWGQATPAGQWLTQQEHEWVLLLKGQAGLRFRGQSETRRLVSGDYFFIPAGTAHRVEWTAENEPTIWLAVHYQI